MSLLRDLVQSACWCVFETSIWRKSAVYIRYLRNNITMLLIPKSKIKLLLLICSYENLFDHSFFYSFILWMLHPFSFINGMFKALRTEKLPRGTFLVKSFLQMCLYSNVYDAISLFRNKWEQRHRIPDTMQQAQKFKKLVSQKSRFKMQTCINLC